MAGFKSADGVERGLEGRSADCLLEAALHLVEGGDDAQGGPLSRRPEGEQSGAGVGGIDATRDKAVNDVVRLK